MENNLKIGDELILNGYEKACIGYVTTSSYLIHKWKTIKDESGRVNRKWLFKTMEVEWVFKNRL